MLVFCVKQTPSAMIQLADDQFHTTKCSICRERGFSTPCHLYGGCQNWKLKKPRVCFKTLHNGMGIHAGEMLCSQVKIMNNVSCIENNID